MGSRYIPPTPTAPTKIISSTPLSISTAHSLLASHIASTTSSANLFAAADPATVAALKRIELSMRGIYGHEAEEIEILENIQLGGDAGNDQEPVYEEEEQEDVVEEEYAPTELADVPGAGEEDMKGGGDWQGEVVVDKEARKKAKKERMQMMRAEASKVKEEGEVNYI